MTEPEVSGSDPTTLRTIAAYDLPARTPRPGAGATGESFAWIGASERVPGPGGALRAAAVRDQLKALRSRGVLVTGKVSARSHGRSVTGSTGWLSA